MLKLKFCNKAVAYFMLIMALLVLGCNGSGSDIAAVNVPNSRASLYDSRDGQTYKIVTIGSQTWMAENLNYEMAKSSCFKNDPSMCEKYGRLYFWAAAMEACPQGWHLPSLEEWKILMDAVGGENVAGSVLKAKTGWRNNGNGSDLYGFSVLPAGYGCEKFEGEGVDAYFWSSYNSSCGNEFGACYGSMDFDDDKDEAWLFRYDEDCGFSVRCLKN